MTPSSYALSQTNKLMSQTFDPLYSYNLKVTVADYFYSVEQIISIGTKQVLLDFLSNGNGIGIGKVAETNGYIDCGWPLKLSTPLAIAYGGTGSVNADAAIANLGGVKKSGDTMTKFLIAEDDQEPDEDLTLEERVTRLEKRVAMLEAYDGAVG